MKNLVTIVMGIMIAAPVGAAEIMLNKNENNQFLSIQGLLAPGTAKKLRGIYENAKKRETEDTKRPTVLILNSGGGALEETSLLSEAINILAHDQFTRFARDLLVVWHETCASACTILGAQLTKDRLQNHITFLVDPNLKFGFHAPVSRLKNGRFVEIKDPKERISEIARVREAYTAAGVSAEWLDANQSALSGSRLTKIDSQNICEADVGLMPKDACLQPEDDLFTHIESLYNPAFKGSTLKHAAQHQAPLSERGPHQASLWERAQYWLKNKTQYLSRKLFGRDAKRVERLAGDQEG